MPSIRAPGIIAGLLGTMMFGVYLAIIINEGNDTVAEVAPWAATIAAASAAALVGSFVAPGSAGKMMVRVAAGLFLVVGVLSLFSIGLPLVVAAVLCLVTSERLPTA